MRFFWLLAAVVAIAAPAQADPARDALAEIAKCSDIAAAVERLTCFDAAAGAAKTALAAPLPAQQPGGQAEEEGGVLAWFGLTSGPEDQSTKPEEFGKPPPRVTKVNQLSASVMEFSKNAYGRAIFILDNGQVWKQIQGDTSEVHYTRSGGVMKVTIKDATFGGGYVLSIEGRNHVVKVQRLK